jgi:hypothetical protein
VIEFRLPGAAVAFSTRNGGVSRGPYASLNLGVLTDDDPDAVSENRRLLAAAVGAEPDGIAMGWQVHGTELSEWHGPPSAEALQKVDGHLTAEAGLPLLVLVADCLPVALAGNGRVAMLHCGWRGLAGGILERALDHFGEPPAAVLGPAIGPCCYEVGLEVLAAFEPLEGVAQGRMLDLKAVARRKLAAAGVDHVEDAAYCTSCRPDLFFSHRRDGGVTGRQGGLVWRT